MHDNHGGVRPGKLQLLTLPTRLVSGVELTVGVDRAGERGRHGRRRWGRTAERKTEARKTEGGEAGGEELRGTVFNAKAQRREGR